MNTKPFQMLCEHKILQDIDVQFADFLFRLAGEKASDDLYMASLLVSHTTTSEKDVCLDLKAAAGKPILELFPHLLETQKPDFSDIITPKLTRWRNRLRQCTLVGRPGEYKPLILDSSDRLYLYRYWRYEQLLVQSIKARVTAVEDQIKFSLLSEGLKRYFPESPTLPDWQKVAAFIALTRKFCLISGGPGTGKTFTVAKILALLLEQNQDLRIRMCAPTGKAAARLKESILEAKAAIPCSEEVKERIPEKATTVHRLLGSRSGRLDVLIIDEASMISFMLMAKLMQFIPEGAKIVLLGDKDQLASVESGAILGDICQAATTHHYSKSFAHDYSRVSGEQIRVKNLSEPRSSLSDSIVELQYSYRFEAEPAIGALSRAVNQGDAFTAINIIRDKSVNAVIGRDLPPEEGLEQALQKIVEREYKAPLTARTIEMAFEYFDRFKILCSHRQGGYGVSRVNQLIENILLKKGLVETNKRYYKGRPIMITQNHYHLSLFNGDMGIIWQNNKGQLRAYFRAEDGRLRHLSPARLPSHDTAYAMTIHKSQGSEFESLLMILPGHESMLLTRELVYTGFTRAKSRIEIWMDEGVFSRAVSSKIERISGLQQNLNSLER